MRRFFLIVGLMAFSASAWAEPPRAPAPSFRVVTYNVHLGQGFKDPDGFARFLNEDPSVGPFDVLGVQEICGDHDQAQVKAMAALLERKGPIHTHFVSSDPGDVKQCGKGQAIFSRHPILGSGFRMLPLVHRPRVMIWVDLEINGRAVRVYDLHLAFRADNFMFSAGGRKRQIQGAMQDFLEFRASHPGAVTVVTGDFNSVNHVLDVGTREGCIKEMRKAFDPSLDHYAATFGPWQLDWIFSDGAPILESNVVREGRYSDHHAVYADYDLAR